MTKYASKIEDQSVSSAKPLWRLQLLLLASLVAALALAFLIFAVHKNPLTKPSDISAGSILLYSLGTIVLLVVPWRDIGLVPKKIGEIEFDTVISTQKKEQIDANVALQSELHSLRLRLVTLELSARSLDGSGSAEKSQKGVTEVETAETDRRAELMDLLMGLLKQHKGTFFNPLRLSNWGPKQPGFSRLSQYTKEEITQALSVGVAAHRVSLKVSTKGNSLYGVSSLARKSS